MPPLVSTRREAPSRRTAGSRTLPLLLVASSILSPGCFGARYLTQAARGELAILQAARPNREVLQDAALPGRTRRLVASVRSVKEFGERQGIRPTHDFERFADLRRPAAVWLVQACAPLSFDVKRWSFPLVGSIPYLGFFDRGDAVAYGATVEREGLDVDVRGASAYSTLGWIRDPILSTMIPEGQEALGEVANVVLHESVHATVYVRDQSAFNESLASFVADGLTLPWLVSVLGPADPETVAWRDARAAHQQRLARLHAAYSELDAVYRSAIPDDRKRAEKARVLGTLQGALRFRRPINNATLAGFRAYGTGFDAFERLRVACGGSWARMLGAIRTLVPEDFGRPQQERFEPVVDRLARDGCRAAPARALNPPR
jgi:predicted aminopeptidase